MVEKKVTSCVFDILNYNLPFFIKTIDSGTEGRCFKWYQHYANMCIQPFDVAALIMPLFCIDTISRCNIPTDFVIKYIHQPVIRAMAVAG